MIAVELVVRLPGPLLGSSHPPELGASFVPGRPNATRTQGAETNDPRRRHHHRQARPANAILEAFRANVPAVHAEAGCIEYGPAIDAEGVGGFQTKFGPDTFLVIEKWETMDHLKAHGASPHMAAYAAKTKDLIASRVIHILSPT